MNPIIENSLYHARNCSITIFVFLLTNYLLHFLMFDSRFFAYLVDRPVKDTFFTCRLWISCEVDFKNWEIVGLKNSSVSSRKVQRQAAIDSNFVQANVLLHCKSNDFLTTIDWLSYSVSSKEKCKVCVWKVSGCPGFKKYYLNNLKIFVLRAITGILAVNIWCWNKTIQAQSILSCSCWQLATFRSNFSNKLQTWLSTLVEFALPSEKL